MHKPVYRIILSDKVGSLYSRLAFDAESIAQAVREIVELNNGVLTEENVIRIELRPCHDIDA